MTPAQEQELRALAAGYRTMYEDATAVLLRIRDELSTRDEIHSAVGEALEDFGLGNDDA